MSNMTFEEKYLDLLRILRIHASHDHESVVRYVKNHMEAVTEAQAYKGAVVRFGAELERAGRSIREQGYG